MSQIAKLFLDVAFTIEGRDEEELPECALATASLLKFPMGSAVDDGTFFREVRLVTGLSRFVRSPVPL